VIGNNRVMNFQKTTSIHHPQISRRSRRPVVSYVPQ